MCSLVAGLAVVEAAVDVGAVGGQRARGLGVGDGGGAELLPRVHVVGAAVERVAEEALDCDVVVVYAVHGHGGVAAEVAAEELLEVGAVGVEGVHAQVGVLVGAFGLVGVDDVAGDGHSAGGLADLVGQAVVGRRHDVHDGRGKLSRGGGGAGAHLHVLEGRAGVSGLLGGFGGVRARRTLGRSLGAEGGYRQGQGCQCQQRTGDKLSHVVRLISGITC